MQWSKYIIILLSVFVFLVSSCGSNSKADPVLTTKDYLVYITIINRLSTSLSSRLVIVSDSTLSSYPNTQVDTTGLRKYIKYVDLGIGKHTPLLSDGMKRFCTDLDFAFFKPEFEKNNINSCAIALDSIHVLIRVVQENNDSTNSEIVRKSNALRIWFSRIAFNQQNNEAIVYLDYLCGDGCGAGEWWWLTKSEGSWKLRCPIPKWAY